MPKRMIQLYMAPEVRDAMRDTERRLGINHEELLLSAVEETRGRVASFLTPSAGTLFPGRTHQVRPRANTEVVQVGIRVDLEHVAALDDLVSASPTHSRTAYCVAALTMYLTANAVP